MASLRSLLVVFLLLFVTGSTATLVYGFSLKDNRISMLGDEMDAILKRLEYYIMDLESEAEQTENEGHRPPKFFINEEIPFKKFGKYKGRGEIFPKHGDVVKEYNKLALELKNIRQVWEKSYVKVPSDRLEVDLPDNQRARNIVHGMLQNHHFLQDTPYPHNPVVKYYPD